MNKLVFCSADSRAFANDKGDDLDPEVRRLFDSEVVFYPALDLMLANEFKVESDEATQEEYRTTADLIRAMAAQQAVLTDFAARVSATVDFPKVTRDWLQITGSPSFGSAASLLSSPEWVNMVKQLNKTTAPPPWLRLKAEDTPSATSDDADATPEGDESADGGDAEEPV